MKRRTGRRAASALLALVLLVSLLPTAAYAADADTAVALPDGKYLISQTDYTLAEGITETQLILNEQSGDAQVKGYLTTIAPTAQAEFKASYSGYYTKGSTAESRAEAAGSLAWDMRSTTKQAADFEAATGRSVILATNADYFNMQTGQACGYLIMEGNVVQTKGSTEEPYFAVLKDGSYAIRDYGTDCSDVAEAISGPFYLVEDGVAAEGLDASGKAPRNAIGLKADGTVVLFLADGRQGVSAGMTLQDMAYMMEKQGCVDALYLDGGGSATIASKHEGSDTLTIQNTPSDGTERVVSSTLLLVSTATGSGRFDHASLSPNNLVYIAGASVSFEASGVDTAGLPTDVPAGVTWALEDSSFGSIDAQTGVFQSNGKCGTVTARLLYDGAVVGSTSIEVQELDTLYFDAESVNLSFKTTTDLGLNVLYKEREVLLSGVELDWTVTPTTAGKTADEIGTVSDNLFTSVKAKETLSATVTAAYTKADGTTLADTIAVEIGKMPQVLFDFEPDEDGQLAKCAECDWGTTNSRQGYSNTFGDESMELTYLSFDNVADESGATTPTLVTKTATGPFSFGGEYIGNTNDVTYDPAAYIFGSAGYSFFTWHASYMKEGSAKAEIVSSETGETRFGDYALRLDYDYTDLADGYKNVNEYLYYSCTNDAAKTDLYAGIDIPGTPTGFGVWVYAPEGTPNFWIWTQIAYWDSDAGYYRRAYVHFKTQEGRSIQYNGIYWDGWMYCEADISGYAKYVSSEHPLRIINGQALILLTFIPGGSANENGDKIPMGDFASGSLYFDNFRVVYGDTVDDMEKPEFSSIQANGLELAEDNSTVVASNTVTLSAAFSDPESDTSTGISTAKTALYVDGIRQTLTESSESAASATRTLANGTHSVKFVISDGFGNVNTVTRYLTVDNPTSAWGSVALSGASTGALGETYTLTLTASGWAELQALSLDVALNDSFGEPTVAFAAGYTGSFSYADGSLHIEATAASPTDATVATVSFTVPADAAKGDLLTYEVTTGSFTEDGTALSFAQPKASVGVTAAYTLTADVMTAGGSGKLYVTKADGSAPGRVELYAVTDGADDTLIGTTNRSGVLVTNRFCQTAGESFTVYAKGDDGLSFRYSGVTSGLGSDEVTPTNVRLNAVEDPTTSQSISWFSAPDYTEAKALVEYVDKDAYDSGSYVWSRAAGDCQTQAFSSDSGATQLCSATLTGLAPGTTYCYRVGDGVDGHWSAVQSFTTTTAQADTSFFILGDTQLSGSAAADADELDMMRQMAQQINAADVQFGLQTGDFIDDAGSLAAWNEILGAFSENYGSTPIVQVMGNHEYYGDVSGTHAETIFDLADEDYYSVEYGNVYIAVINCNANLEAAAQWLADDAAQSDCEWKLLTVHQPAYYTNPKGSSAAYNAYLPAAVDAAGIDFVFSGHDHAYARTEPLTGGAVDEEGAVYFICGDLGEKSRNTSYAAEDNPDFHFAKISQDYDAVYLLARTEGNTMTVTAYDLDGTVLDSYTMHHATVCEKNGHSYVYADGALKCSVCGETAPETYAGWATDGESGKDMYFLGGQYKTGWFTLDTALYHFGEDGLAHELTVDEDIPTTCDTQGHKTVTCACGETYTLTYGAPTGHRYVETTADDGTVYYVCTSCGKVSRSDLPFVDVDDDDWFASAAEYCYRKDYIKGTTKITFSPDTNITREMLATILWRMSGAPTPESSTSPFTDGSSNYAAEAIRWAAENGLINGYPDGTFGAKNTCTRQEMVTIFYRYAAFIGMDTEARIDLTESFTDAGSINRYAQNAVSWAVAEGIIHGFADKDAGTSTFQPQGTATRAQVATVIMYMMQLAESQTTE